MCERCSQEATGELLEIERLTSSLERGHGKSTRQGNSLVAYSTSRPVVCPAKAGVFGRRKTYQGKSQSPVARRAGGRETNLLKPLDRLICGMGASFQAVAQANAQVAPKVIAPEAEPATVKAKAAWAVADWLTRRTTPAGWERQHGDKDTPSNWRDPPRPAAKSAEAR